MQFLEEEIIEITETTWNAMLGIEIQRTPSEVPEPSNMSLSEVEQMIEWATDAIEATRVSQLSFESEGQPMTVTVWKRELSNA